MARTPSTMLALGTKAPSFSLPNTEHEKVSLNDFIGKKGLLVMFICNHCPYVLHVRKALAELTTEWMNQGIGVVGINANDPDNYPDDSPEKMVTEKKQAGYHFPYLFDATQSVAKAYHAACTPDFFLFDGEMRLIYRGQMDGSRPGNAVPNDGVDLNNAITALLTGKSPTPDQHPSLGCNIKWKPGNEPTY